MALADEFDGLLVDLDGVVWIGREPVPGAAEALAELLEAGKPIVFVTNNPGKAAGRLRGAAARRGGAGRSEEQIVTAGMVTARLAAEAAGEDGGAFVIGAPPPSRRRSPPPVRRLLEGEAGREAARCSSPATAASTTRSC